MSNDESKDENGSSSQEPPWGEDARREPDQQAGPKKVRTVHLRSQDKKELKRVLKSREEYKSLSRLLWDHLDRSLLPRIHRGDYRPRRLTAEVARRNASSSVREQAQVGLPSWTAVEEAACIVNRDLRCLAEALAWRGSIRGFPFCLLGPSAIVRAAAREIATSTQGGPAEFFSGKPFSEKLANRSHEENPSASKQRASIRQDPSEEKSSEEEAPRQEDSEEKSGAPPAGSGPTYQALSKLPGRKRAGKPVMLPITAEAKDRLIEKTRGRAWDGSDLARGALRKLLKWIQEAPGKAFDYIRAGSELYQPCREGSYRGYQLYIEPDKKRELEQTRAFLQKFLRERPGRSFERRLNQKEILQGAARLAIETSGPQPPLPGQSSTGG